MKSTKNIHGAPIESTSDLAKRLHLSRWTISRVLNGHAGVSAETVRRVKEAMRELGFVPNSLASGLRKGKTNMIGICLPEIERLYLSPKLEFLRQALSAEGWHVMLGVTNGDRDEEAETLSRFRTLHAAGVMLFASRLQSRGGVMDAFHQAGIPLVSVDPFVPPSRGCVWVDRAVGMREALEHLFGFGHRRVIALGLGEGDRYRAARLAGVAAAFEGRKLDFEANVCRVPLDWKIESAFQQGCEAAGPVWLKARETPGYTAVLAVNDRVAIGLIDGLRKLGVRVPEDLSVVGYDNMEVGAFVSPRLTSVDAQPDELIRRATECLLSQIRKEEGAGDEAGVALLPPVATRLVVRGSTGPARSIG